MEDSCTFRAAAVDRSRVGAELPAFVSGSNSGTPGDSLGIHVLSATYILAGAAIDNMRVEEIIIIAVAATAITLRFCPISHWWMKLGSHFAVPRATSDHSV